MKCWRPAICLIISFILKIFTTLSRLFTVTCWLLLFFFGLCCTALLGRKNPHTNKLKQNLRSSDLWSKGRRTKSREERVKLLLSVKNKNNCKERLAVEILSVYGEMEPSVFDYWIPSIGFIWGFFGKVGMTWSSWSFLSGETKETMKLLGCSITSPLTCEAGQQNVSWGDILRGDSFCCSASYCHFICCSLCL